MPPRRRIAPSSGSPSPVESDSESVLPTPPNRFNSSSRSIRVPSTASTSIQNESGKPSEEELVISDSEDQAEDELNIKHQEQKPKRPTLGSRSG